MTETPMTPEAIAAAYEASPQATQNLIDALTRAASAKPLIDIQEAKVPEDWPWGKGTEEDPLRAPDGWSLDFTQEQAAAHIEAAKAEKASAAPSLEES